MKEIIVTKAEQKDLDDLVRLFDLYRVFYEQESDFTSAYTFISERLYQNDSVIFIARDSESVAVGFTQLYPTFSSQSMQRMWILNDLFVQEESRKAGVASELLDRAKAFSQSESAKGLMLCTKHTNLKAQALYKKQGFEPLNDFQWHFLATP